MSMPGAAAPGKSKGENMATAKKNYKEEYERLGEELSAAEQAVKDAEGEEEVKAAKAAFDKTMSAFQKAADKYYNEKVTIRLFKDTGKYQDDLYVGWNGRGFLIQRGVDVDVPRGVAEIIRESEDQRQAASMHMQELQEEYTKAAAKGTL